MKLKKTILLTAISMTLPASMLFAQDAAPQQPPQPPNAPQGLPPAQNGNQQQPGARPDGQRGGGQGDWHRRGPSLFELLDTNHDGVIDAEELKNAPEALKKLDRRGDGKITPDELFPQFDGRSQRRPQDGNAQQGDRPQAQPGQPTPQSRGDWNRRPGFDQGGPQAPRPNNGPSAQPQSPAPQPGGPGAAPKGPQGPQAWNQRRPESGQRFDFRQQWQGRNQGPQQPGQQFAQNGSQGGDGQRHHHHHRGQFGPQQGFAQNRPQFGPRGWDFQRGPQGPQDFRRFSHRSQGQDGQRDFRRGPQFGQQWGQRGPGFQRGPQGPQDFRRFSHRSQGQDGQRDFRRGPQWGHKHHHHHGQFGPQQGQGFAQNRSQFGQQWGQRGQGFQRGPQDFRRFSHRSWGQDGQRDFRRGPQFGPQQRGESPRQDGRRFDGRGVNPQSAPAGPRLDDRNPAGNAPQHRHFHPGFTDNGAPEGSSAAGPQGEAAPEFLAPAPAPTSFGTSEVPAAAPGDVI